MSVHRFRVEGVEDSYSRRFPGVRPFDETFEIEGEHPAEALEKLVGEIEWGILDGERPFTISYLVDE
jgi:hypothetical protein